MYRATMKKLVEWKSGPQRKPLLLYGARQVGKSYLIEQFAKENYTNYAMLNLEESPRLKAAFEGDLSPRVVISNLEQLLGLPLNTKDMLLVFDEIQVSSRALTSLKYFQEQMPERPVIAAGSLLGVAVNRNETSAPVGKIDTLTLHPMSFDEFLIAMGRESMLDGIRSAYEQGATYQLHEQALELYRAYLLVGGMPEAVSTYRETGSIGEVQKAHRDILSLYLADMVKYAQSSVDVARVRDTWNSIPAQLARENRKFQYKTIKSGARSAQYSSAIDWLLAAGLVNNCPRISSGAVLLRLQEDVSAFKIHTADTGLLCTMAEVPAAALIDHDSRKLLDSGGITENYVVQQLASREIVSRYWTSGNTAEVDVVIEDGSAYAIPVEVKSSENVRSRSLKVYCDKYSPKRCARLSPKNLARDGEVESIPLYAAGVFADDIAARKAAPLDV